MVEAFVADALEDALSVALDAMVMEGVTARLSPKSFVQLNLMSVGNAPKIQQGTMPNETRRRTDSFIPSLIILQSR